MIVLAAAVVAVGLVGIAAWQRRAEMSMPIPPLQLGSDSARAALLQARQEIEANLASRLEACKSVSGAVRKRRCKNKAIRRANNLLGRLDRVVKRAAGRQLGGGIGELMKDLGDSGLLSDIAAFTGGKA